MIGRLKTGGFLVGLFLTMLVIKLTGVVPEGIFAYVLTACLVMAAIELFCAGAVRRQPALRTVSSAPRPEDIFPAAEIGLIGFAIIALIGGPLDDWFDPILTFPMADAVAMYILLLSASTDAIAYAAGSLATKLGVSHRVKALAKISAKKTYEGYLAGLIGSSIISWIFICVLPEHFAMFAGTTDTLYCQIFAIVACPTVFAGDLMGSVSKRVLNIKDSNQFTENLFFVRWLEKPMAGHGGYLDRFDSTCLCICIYMAVQLVVAPSLWI